MAAAMLSVPEFMATSCGFAALPLSAFAEALAEDPESDYGLETLNGYSKSPARSDDALVNIGMATIVVNGDTGEVVSYADDIE